MSEPWTYRFVVKRRVLTILLLLLLGTVVNVGVAWGCATWIDLTGVVPEARSPQRVGRYGWRTFDTFQRHGASRRGWRVWVVVLVNGANGGAVNLQDDFMKTLAQTDVPEIVPGEIHDRRGWPLLSMQCTFVTASWDVLPATGFVPHGGIQLATIPGTDERGLRALPLRPIWRGFAVNTVFYAALLWLLICCPIVARRFVRIKRGLCPACAYPMGESAVCSECGAALPGRARTA